MEPELNPPFDLRQPDTLRAGVLFNAPHSGRIYPKAFLKAARLDANNLRRSEDAFVDELFAGVVARGAPLLKARFPRAYLDVNREPYELDPTMFDGDLPDFANVSSIRVAGGLGTIARIVAERHEIYRKRLPVSEALKRINTLYRPYHAALRATLAELRSRFGVAILIDCHSMPSLRHENGRRPDFVLGDRFGTSCSRLLMDVAHDRLRRLGYSVTRNKPYAGGYITETYGRPVRGIHALQIEINRALYMDEKRFRKTAHFAAISADLMVLAEEIMALRPRDLDLAEAAE